MHWLTVAYSMTATACVTLAAVHLLVWFKQREQLSHLAFAFTAVLVAAIHGALQGRVIDPNGARPNNTRRAS